MRCIFIVIALAPLLVTAQTTYQGTVHNKRTNEPISFATVGLVKENTGANADDLGRFRLVSNRTNPQDTIIISSIGYETLRLPVNGLPEHISIGLVERENRLSEVVFTRNRNLTVDTLNNFKSQVSDYQGMNESHTQIAQLFEASNDQFKIKAVEIRTALGSFYRNRSRFRIRVYDVDSLTGKPSVDLYPKIIEVNQESRQTIVDMESYGIKTPTARFFIAVEVLKIPANENDLDMLEQYVESQNLDSNGNPLIKPVRYRPSAGLISSERDDLKAWVLHSNGQWVPISGKKNSAAIKVTVTY